MSYSYRQSHNRYHQNDQRSLPPVSQQLRTPTMAFHDYISPAMSQQPRSSVASYDQSPAPAMTYSASSDSNSSRHTTSSTSSSHYQTNGRTSNSPSQSQSRYTTSTDYAAQDDEPESSQMKRTSSRSSRPDSQRYVLCVATVCIHDNSLTLNISPRYICVHPGCESSFSRPADLSRHQVSVHFRDGVMLDCPRPRCARKGDQGFSRQDHLIEHLRQFHCMKLAKRSSKSQRCD